MTCFRTCSSCCSRSQASLCHCTDLTMSDRNQLTFVLLRYPLGGDRPSQTAHQTLSSSRSLSSQNFKQVRAVFQGRLHMSWRSCFDVSRLSCTNMFKVQCQAAVKVHGVFPSSRGYTASSQRFRFHWVSGGDSVAMVTPFVQVRTYLTRNFATLGPLQLRPPFTGASLRSFSLRLTPSFNLPAPGRCHTLYFPFQVCRVLCFC